MFISIYLSGSPEPRNITLPINGVFFLNPRMPLPNTYAICVKVNRH